MDGAVALISGRSIDDLDRLFMPLRFCASGIHGCERREANGCVVRPPLASLKIGRVRHELDVFVSQRPGLILEDKHHALAIHFRQAPELEGEVRGLMRALCKSLGPDYRLQTGKCVLEIRLSGYTKGTAIAEFMRHSPFAGRTPVFIGDDISDEQGFFVVNELGGVSINVGNSIDTLAKHRLNGVSDVLQWLEGMAVDCSSALA
jgi:trehalose 6-phosphate phosphatase